MNVWEGIAMVLAIVAMNAVVAVVAYRSGRLDERWENEIADK
ncbi:hypothetical protein [Caenibacillus caldisaponilyticus]|nr:hypothetical protein [Caenibacillus caldisaponilyticus]